MIALSLDEILSGETPGKRLRGRKRLGKRWSTNYPNCLRCSGISSPHLARGLCYRCYHADVNARRQAERTEKRAVELFPKVNPRPHL